MVEPGPRPEAEASGPSRQPVGRRVVERAVAALVAHPWLTLVILTGLTVGSVLYGSGITVRSDLEGLFPDDTPAVVRARRARELLGQRSRLDVLIGGPSQDDNRAAARELGATFGGWDGLVRQVEVRRDPTFFEKNALLFLSMEDLRELDAEVTRAIADAVEEELDDFEDFDKGEEAPGATTGKATEPERLPTEDELKERYGAEGFHEYFETEDGTVVLLSVTPTFPPADIAQSRELDGRVRAALARMGEVHPDLSFATDGDYAHASAAMDKIASEGWTAFLVALGGIFLILVVYFRRIRAVVLTIATLVASAAWTFAVARLALGELNVVTVAIFSVVVGLGIDYVVHATARTDEALNEGLPLTKALPIAYGRVAGALAWGAIAATATFFALSVFEFRGFSDFGLLAGLGVLLCLLGAFVVLPPLEIALARWLPRRRVAPPSTPPGRSGPRPRARFVGAATLAVVGLLSAAGAFQAAGMPFDADTRKLRVERPSTTSELRTRYRDGRKVKAGGSPALIVTESLEATRRVHRHLAELAETEPLLNRVRSIVDFVPDDQPAKLARVAEIRRKLRNKYDALEGQSKADADRLSKYLEPQAFSFDDLPEWLREQFTDSEGRLGRYVLLDVSGVKSDARHVQKIQAALGTVEVDGQTYEPAASWLILGDALTLVQREGPLAIGLAALVVLLLLGIDLRRPTKVLAVYAPIVCGFLVLLGLLRVLDIRLDIFNIVVLPTIFGIGVDTAIHLVHRFEEGDAFPVVMRTTGRAAAVSAATDAVGFLALTLMSSEVLQSIGLIAVLGIVTNYIVSVAVIGALVAVGWLKARKGEPP